MSLPKGLMSVASRAPRVLIAVLASLFAVGMVATGFASAATPPTNITVTPSTGLADNQSVAVTGTDFAAGASTTLSECAPNSGSLSCITVGTTATDSSGNLSTNVNVQKTFTATSGVPGTIDCTVSNCFIDANDNAGGHNAQANISFAAPPAVNPNVTVTPNSNLSASQSASALGTGYTPGASVTFYECKLANGVPQSCGVVGSGGLTDSNGAFGPVAVTLVRTFNATQGSVQGTVDCLPENTCIFEAIDSQNVDDTTPISFAPPAAPAVTVTPNANLSASQNVNVSGTGFAPGATTNFFECKTVNGAVTACAPVGSGTMTDSNGAFGPVSVPVTSTFTPTQGDLTPVDCHVDTCVLEASAAGQDAFAPIHFASTQGPGVLTVTPNNNLAPTQQVAVSGTNFSDQASVSIFECKPNTPVQSCVLIGTALTDNNGNFGPTDVTVTNAFTATSGTTGPVTCLPENNCLVEASDPGGREGSASITFAVPQEETTTTTSTSTTTTTIPPSRVCATLTAARARFNASIDRVEAVTPPALWFLIEPGRIAGNAGYDAALALNGCPRVNTQALSTPRTAATPTSTRSAAVSAQSAPTARPQTVTVAPGDSLSRIAQRVLGNANAYPVLAQLNGIANPSMIFPGQVLQIPAS